MPKKTAPKKTKPTTAKVNKSAFIRAQPATMSASEVVEKAKADGFEITANFVYSVRSAGKPKAKKGSNATKGKKPVATGTGNAEQLIRRAALMVGIDAVEALVRKLRTEAGL